MLSIILSHLMFVCRFWIEGFDRFAKMKDDQ